MLVKNSIVLKIESTYRALTKSERKVADVILDNPNEIIYLSISDLAMKSGVAETTVVRFCRRIGYSGFQDFKLNLAQELVEPEKSIHESISFDDSTEEVIQKLTYENIAVLNNTAQLLDKKVLENVIQLIIDARRVDFYGVGASGFTALDAKYKFMRLGLQVDANLDPHIQAISAANLGPGDVAIGISYSGSNKDTIATCQTAKQSGATVISITNYAQSPITKVSDYVLLTSAKETPLRSGALTSKIAQLHVLDILYTATAIRLKEKALASLNRTANAVLDKLY
ncbi:MAG: Sialic acid utilization regulator, RpiR family [Candidatus Carbobacillus altaicus]|uniref:Sialic acid utilization regulator, RpiR family n=1 Tax=Candidatus Carbonibacillus altaicus TaxID=2163959 RepID=A0A2R6Y3W4_9BACL|nr:MAG: Sialic acid utilization regulator, RpiR family [Candidatus Carbobacillus altaicus]